jgi:hypothetical protein
MPEVNGVLVIAFDVNVVEIQRWKVRSDKRPCRIGVVLEFPDERFSEIGR